jgi:opacity protein-like surface antigen
MFTLGAGLERYVWQSWAVDASVRYHGMIQNSKLNNDIQFQLGVIFYVAY